TTCRRSSAPARTAAPPPATWSGRTRSRAVAGRGRRWTAMSACTPGGGREGRGRRTAVKTLVPLPRPPASHREIPAMKTMLRRVARLEAKLPPPSPEVALRLQQCAPLFDRWDQLLDAAWPLLGADDQGHVNTALGKLHEKQSGPYAIWFNGLLLGWSRLPALAPPVMKDLLLTWLYPAGATGFACRG